MENLKDFIESGIIEAYVLGLASPDEILVVEAMQLQYPEVQQSIDNFCEKLETTGFANATPPPSSVKTMVMASIDFMERMQGGEPLGFPGELTSNSKIIDFTEWLSRPDMVAPSNFEDMYAKIIGYTPTETTAIVWIKTMAPQEVHTDEHERFLIIEGTCDITIDTDIHHLSAGDYLAIPLFKTHHVVVTSKTPCKVILQRAAA